MQDVGAGRMGLRKEQPPAESEQNMTKAGQGSRFERTADRWTVDDEEGGMR